MWALMLQHLYDIMRIYFSRYFSILCTCSLLMTVNYSLFLVSFSSHFGVHKATYAARKARNLKKIAKKEIVT